MQKYVVLFFIIFCTKNTIAQTQAEMNKQAQQEYVASDKRMSTLYKEVMNSLDPASKKLLLDAQRNWIKFKESHCHSVENAFEGGSIQPLIYYSCLIEITNDRIKQLQQYLEKK